MTGRRAGVAVAAAAASSASSSNGNGVAPRRSSGTTDGTRGGAGGSGTGGGRAGYSSSGGGGDRGQQFHPKLITTQIIALQCCHYFILGVLFQLNYLFYSTSITVDRIFTDTYVRIWHPSGWPDVCAIVLASLAGWVR
jgi:Integral membrane protein S linking to the trans Golgi network